MSERLVSDKAEVMQTQDYEYTRKELVFLVSCNHKNCQVWMKESRVFQCWNRFCEQEIALLAENVSLVQFGEVQSTPLPHWHFFLLGHIIDSRFMNHISAQ
jgi:hypothetical protein